MQTTIYATFQSPDSADLAFVELLERGVSLLDVVVLTRLAYKEPEPGTEDGRLDISEHGQLEHGCADATPIPPEPFALGDVPPVRDPFEQTEGGIRLLDNLTYPGDLAECLQKLGFTEHAAQTTERAMLDGGAILILRVPSGPVEELQAWEAIERFIGTIVVPTQRNPYLG